MESEPMEVDNLEASIKAGEEFHGSTSATLTTKDNENDEPYVIVERPKSLYPPPVLEDDTDYESDECETSFKPPKYPLEDSDDSEDDITPIAKRFIPRTSAKASASSDPFISKMNAIFNPTPIQPVSKKTSGDLWQAVATDDTLEQDIRGLNPSCRYNVRRGSETYEVDDEYLKKRREKYLEKKKMCEEERKKELAAQPEPPSDITKNMSTLNPFNSNVNENENQQGPIMGNEEEKKVNLGRGRGTGCSRSTFKNNFSRLDNTCSYDRFLRGGCSRRGINRGRRGRGAYSTRSMQILSMDDPFSVIKELKEKKKAEKQALFKHLSQ